jgi:release factor glutamine methyltransferase
MTTIKDYRANFLNALSQIYDEKEAESLFYLTLEDFRNLKRVDLVVNPGVVIPEDEIPQWEFVLAQLKKEIPIQYILGKAHFFGMEFEVNDNVLIPRPETEELVEWIISDHKKSQKSQDVKVLDIGTGSGCIAIALAKNLPNAKVSAIDVSKGALAMAEKNARTNRADVRFIHKDILKTEGLDETFDIIVSNPPYVRHLEKKEIKKNVLNNEPHLALFVDDQDALLFYRKIAALAKNYLSENGKLFLEINQYLGKETMDLLEQTGFSHLELRKDIYGNDRMILAVR